MKTLENKRGNLTPRFYIVTGILSAILILFVVLEATGVIWHTEIFSPFYEVQGIDVSHYQEEIDWEEIPDTYQFAFIKATEGHDYVDPRFTANWAGSREADIKRGAYHFFSMRSSGKEQAEYFIHTVPKEDDSMPPVVDFEIFLDHDKETVRKELLDFLTIIEDHYGKTPIIYMTNATYKTYLKKDYQKDFGKYPIWIRDIFFMPTIDDPWIFWQYTMTGDVPGIKGNVDKNVFNGNKKVFDEFYNQ